MPKSGRSKASKPVDGKKPAKSSRSSGTNSSGAPPIDQSALKCPFEPEELSRWRSELMERRRWTSETKSDLIRDAMEADSGNMAPDHLADRGSDVDTQETSLDMLGDEDDLLWQIDRAIHKIDTGKPIPFGICEHTLKPIPKPRLTIMPWTPISIEAASHMETRGLTIQDMIISEE